MAARRLTANERRWRGAQLAREQRALAREAAREARDKLHEVGIHLLNLRDLTNDHSEPHTRAQQAYSAQQKALARTWGIDVALDGVRVADIKEDQ